MGKWGIWMGKTKEEGKEREEEKSRLFICAVIFLIFGITIGCGGYVDNNGNIVESSDPEQDSIFYQNKELTQFDIDVYQYFKNYKRDYADMISFRKDLPGRVILIIDEGSPITPWDILDLKMKEDGRLELEILEKNKNGEIKLNEGDILIGWVDRFYVKSGNELPEEYVRWVNFTGRVTAVGKDESKRTLLVYAEPEYVGNIFERISLENIYLDWGKILEEADSPEAPVFRLVKVGSDLEAKSFEGKKRILLKFSYIGDCIRFADRIASFLYIYNIGSGRDINHDISTPPFKTRFGEAEIKISAKFKDTRVEWKNFHFPPNLTFRNVPVTIYEKEFEAGLEVKKNLKVKEKELVNSKLSLSFGGKNVLQVLSRRAECVAVDAMFRSWFRGDLEPYGYYKKENSTEVVRPNNVNLSNFIDKVIRGSFFPPTPTVRYFIYSNTQEFRTIESSINGNINIGGEFTIGGVKDIISPPKFFSLVAPVFSVGVALWGMAGLFAEGGIEFNFGYTKTNYMSSRQEILAYGEEENELEDIMKEVLEMTDAPNDCEELRRRLNYLKSQTTDTMRLYTSLKYHYGNKPVRCVKYESTEKGNRVFEGALKGEIGVVVGVAADFLFGFGNAWFGFFMGAGGGIVISPLIGKGRGSFGYSSRESWSGSGELVLGRGLFPLLWAPIFTAFVANKPIWDVRYRVPVPGIPAPYIWVGHKSWQAKKILEMEALDIIYRILRDAGKETEWQTKRKK